MEPTEFPANSRASRSIEEKPRVKQVTSGEVIRKKRSLRKQFADTFVAGDFKTALRYMMFDVLLPAARDMVVDSATGGLEKLIFGDSRRRGSTSPQAGPTGYVSYNRYAMGGSSMSSPQRAISRLGRARHDFDEIALESRGEAEEVIDQLFEVISQYGQATVADLYELVGISTDHTDLKWGWTDLRGAGVTRNRDGYLLDLPNPVPIG